MNPDDTEKKLRALFEDMRARDASASPSFDRLTRAPARREQVAWIRVAATAAAVGVCAAMAVLGPRLRQAEEDTQDWAAFSNWEASTDVLLTMSTTPLGSTVSTATDAWIDSGSSVSEATQDKEEEVL